ncbi:hybrid sensor histidine kinase/response regulator [Microlunatus phosphovorus]|uniref:hybrid sensor histidine kinase/response regulator n=1 Tax=Microlunatus phosphovorus TaxID=29405 RepID=UPI000674D213|nr:ATP-binding protein [Microlunatus phosphovorus]
MPRSRQTVDPSVTAHQNHFPDRARRLLIAFGIGWALAVLLVALLLARRDPASIQAQVIGSVSILAALIFACVCCVLAVRRRTAARLAWIFMAVGMGLGGLGQVGWVLTALSNTESSPSAIADTLSFLGYMVPSVLAVLAFPRRSELLISRFRQLLDALVITIGVLLISEATVLGAVLRNADFGTLDSWLHLAYLVSDVAICALVLGFGMRQLPGDRLTWFFLGSGLLIIAVSDSVYVWLMAHGVEFATATPLAAGWMAGPALIGLATFIPMSGWHSRGRDYTLLLQLLPYLPFAGALVLLGIGVGDRDPYFLTTAGLLLVVVTGRQVMIVYENVSLTRDLEAKVARRTSELAALGSIVTSSTDAIVGVSLDSRITSWNPSAARLYGYPLDHVIGRSPDFLLADAGVDAKTLLARAVRGERMDGYEIDWSRPDGSVVPIALTVSPIVGGERVEGISIFAQDITSRRREAEALERAREEALTTARLKSEFLATMSHEIRTPMNAVIGLTALLLETELDPTQRLYTEGVQSGGDALLSVIDDILDFSKLEAGKVVLEQSDFSLRHVVEEVGALMAPTATTKGLELIAYCLPDVPEALHGDAGRIRQVLLNLASNAVKFTQEGEVIIKVAVVGVDRDRCRLRLEVIDTGIGIAEEHRGRLFESFSQADASTTRRFGGTGLGLAISRRLVEVMGGTITLESEVGVGSRFIVELGLRTATRAEPTARSVSHDLLAGLRVLVVDDNSTNGTLLETQLRSWSMEPEIVDGAQEAFQLLRSAAIEGRPYDLAALDAHMPEVDGLELARRVTMDPILRGLPMIMLTSGLYPGPEAMREAGISQWLPKPVRNGDLFDRLIRLMAPREKELLRRRAHQGESGSPHEPGGSDPVLVVGEDPARRILTGRFLASLGFEIRSVADGEEALEVLAGTAVRAVLIDLEVEESLDVARAIRRTQGAGREIPIAAVVCNATAEDRERYLAVDVSSLLFCPLDTASLRSTLVELPPAQGLHDVPLTTAPEPAEEPDDDVLDLSRLMDLTELVTADGTRLVESMVASYVRRSSDWVEALRDAVATDDREAMVAITHELKGSSGTIGAQRVMHHAAGIEQRTRSGASLSAAAVDDLLAEMDAAVRALSTLGPPLLCDAVESPLSERSGS